jgi:hypothetical protein
LLIICDPIKSTCYRADIKIEVFFMKNRGSRKLVFCMIALACLLGSNAQAQWHLAFQGSLVTSGRPHDLIVQGNYAYLGDWEAGLEIIDVSYLPNPQRVSGYNTVGLANSVTISGRYAYIADWNHGMTVVDVAFPHAPQFVSTWDTPGQATNIYVSGNYAYISDFNGGINIVDISNPASPQLASRYLIGSFATGIWGQGNYIYVSNSVNGLKTYDISTPDTTVWADTYNSDGDASNVTGGNNYIYLSDGLRGVKILSLTDPAHPSFVSEVETPGYVNDASVSDTLLYIADDVTGVIAVSVASPVNPGIIATYNSPGTAVGIYARGHDVYLGDTDSFITLLLTDFDAIDDGSEILPAMFDIKRIYPNPFNPQATVEFSLERRMGVNLAVYNLTGQLVAHLVTGVYEPGKHSIVWNASGLSSGTYLVRLSSGGYSKTIKATILK